MAKNQRPINTIDAEFTRVDGDGKRVHHSTQSTSDAWIQRNLRAIKISFAMIGMVIMLYVSVNDSRESDTVKIAKQQTYQKASEERIEKAKAQVKLAEIEKGVYTSESPQSTTTCVITAEDRANGKKFYFKPNCPRTMVEPLPSGTPFERQLLVMKKGAMKGFEGQYRMIKILPPGVEEVVCQTLNSDSQKFVSDNCKAGIQEQNLDTYLLIYFETTITALQ